jgi:GTPase Era involved in 16S rRNA processing
VAIIGAQSGGKSTLLNKLFNTPFAMMRENIGFEQTTKGCWMCPDDTSKILVFDIEGTDSKERKEQRVVFE